MSKLSAPTEKAIAYVVAVLISITVIGVILLIYYIITANLTEDLTQVGIAIKNILINIKEAK
jgi:hypothetical protein